MKLSNKKQTSIILLLLIILLSAIILIFNINKKTNIPNTKITSNNKSETKNIKDETDKNNSSSQHNYVISPEENKLYNEAYNLFFSHKYDESINKSNYLIEKYPESYMGYNIRGIAKSYNNNFTGGLDDINKALSLKEDYGYALFNKGLTYELYGHMDEALYWYKKNLSVENYVWTYYGIASIYGRQGDVKNTMKYLNQAIKLDPSVKKCAQNESDFNPVKSSSEFQNAVYN